MVVGTTPYKDKKEAFPLDKKTLHQIAMRSFFMRASINSETGTSLGWTWAIAPGLKKIHTDADDYALSLGQNLEYSDPGSWFSTFVMGVSLAAEAQKADPSIIRSVRTSAALAAKSFEKAFFTTLLIPGLLALIQSFMAQSAVMVAVFALIVLVISIVLRFTLINYGYKKASSSIEKMMHDADALAHAARIGGIFMLGAMLVLTAAIPSSIHLFANMGAAPTGVYNPVMTQYGLASVLQWTIAIGASLGCYHLIVKKNWTLVRCAVLLTALGFLLGIVM